MRKQNKTVIIITNAKKNKKNAYNDKYKTIAFEADPRTAQFV